METSTSLEISVFNLFAVILSAVFAVYSRDIIPVFASLVKCVLKPSMNPKITELKSKIAEMKRELNKISPTGEFAKYFKKDREVNKLTEELAALESENSSETARNLKIDTVVRVVCQFSALVLLRYVSGITAYCIPDTIFWPFNVFIRFPAVLGNDSCPSEFAEVSGFALAFFMIHLIDFLVGIVRKRLKTTKIE